MSVNGPERAFFWDAANNSMRPARTGEAGELVWNSSTNSWEPGTIGAEYLWNATTKNWDYGPGGQYVFNHSTRAWDRVTTRAGAPWYWSDADAAWVLNSGVGAAGSDLLLETGDHLLLETGDAILLDA